MWFKVTSKDLNNNLNTHYYNSINHTIKDSTGNEIYLKEDPRLKEFIKEFPSNSKQRQYKKAKVRFLRIQLGLNCNFSCKYCHQAQCKEVFLTTNKVSLPPEVTIKNFIKMLKENNIEVTNRINLWGGEPLVYWKYIKLLVPELVKLYPGIRICIITNGSLLNEEMIQFFIKYRISLTISHDAQGFHAYRNDEDPLDNPKIVKCIHTYLDASEESNRKWFSLSKEEQNILENKVNLQPFGFSFNVVITPANLDIDKIPGYFYLKLNRDVVFHFESMVKASKNTIDVMGTLSEEHKKFITNKIFKHAIVNSVTPKKNPYYSLREDVANLIHLMVNKIDSRDREIICDVASNKNLAIDLQGNILACHGADAERWTIGHISKVTEAINDKVISWKQRPHCPTCPFVSNCGGGCVIASDEDSQSMCEYLKVFHGALFAAAWFAIFNTTLERIEPCPEMEDKCSSE